jgi:hypothetical protein
MSTAKQLDYRCLGNYCLQATQCLRFMVSSPKTLVPMAAFDVRDKPEGKCDGFLARVDNAEVNGGRLADRPSEAV